MRGRFVLVVLLRFVLGVCFMWAAISKLLDPVALFRAVESYQSVPASMGRWIALVLPWLELWAALGLCIRGIRRGSILILIILLVIFIGLHLSAWWRGLDIDCGCFGLKGGSSSYLLLLLRNGLLLAGAWVLLILD